MIITSADTRVPKQNVEYNNYKMLLTEENNMQIANQLKDVMHMPQIITVKKLSVALTMACKSWVLSLIAFREKELKLVDVKAY